LSVLDTLLKSGQSDRAEFIAVRRQLKDLRGIVEACSLKTEAFIELQKILQQSEAYILRIRQSLILDALRFELLDDRFSTVHKAHQKTFEWILHEGGQHGSYVKEVPASSKVGILSEAVNRNIMTLDAVGASEWDTEYPSPEMKSKKAASFALQSWLLSGTGIFHVIGKPGSGKSTLMKFIYNHGHTKRLLNTWSENKKLVLAHFFFWNSENMMQKSLKGLLRGLLFHILTVYPDIIPVVFPTQWNDTEYYVNSGHQFQFNYADTEAAFDTLLKQPDIFEQYRFAFFIDGLDEFQPEGDQSTHYEIVSLFKTWAGLQPRDIKLCVSSREWPVFNKGFVDCPQIRLQELTKHDMFRVVTDAFANSADFERLKVDADVRKKLIEYLVQRSDGVFIWLVLVLQKLEKGLQNEDTLDDLYSKAESLPTDLNKLYDALIESIDEDDREYVYRALGTALAASEPLPEEVYWFAEISDIDSECNGLREKSNVMEVVQLQLEKFRRRLTGRSRGLLEIAPSYGYRKTFNWAFSERNVRVIHRSVRDYLRRSQFFKPLDMVGFAEVLCNAYLVRAKLVNIGGVGRFGWKIVDADYTRVQVLLDDNFDGLFSVLRESCHGKQMASTLVSSLVELDRVFRLHNSGCSVGFNPSRHLEELKETSDMDILLYQKYMASHSAYEYFERIIQEPDISQALVVDPSVLLYWATNGPPKIARFENELSASSTAYQHMLEFCFTHGAAVDNMTNSFGRKGIYSTAWQNLLSSFLLNALPLPRFRGAAEVYLKHGVERHMWLVFGPKIPPSYVGNNPMCVVSWRSGQKGQNSWNIPILVEVPCELVSFGRSNGWVLSIKDLLERAKVKIPPEVMMSDEKPDRSAFWSGLEELHRRERVSIYKGSEPESDYGAGVVQHKMSARLEDLSLERWEHLDDETDI
jgi:hypothetical protein